MNLWNLVCVCQIIYSTNFSLIRKLLDFSRFYFGGVRFILYFREHLSLSGAVHCIFRNSLCNNTCHITCQSKDWLSFFFFLLHGHWTQLGRGGVNKIKEWLCSPLFLSVLLMYKTKDTVSWCVYFNACMRTTTDEGWSCSSDTELED